MKAAAEQHLEFLAAVRDAKWPLGADLAAFVAGVGAGKVPDHQAAAFLMAVFQKGLGTDDLVTLTLAMRDSGAVLTHRDLDRPTVDKHATGGVGDKISLIVAPLVAACGAAVPMISGRSLGHTGGTLDKLESIPGFSVDLSAERFSAQLKEIGVAIIGQSAELAPADRRLYALRDQTATVPSLPLIVSSILSKKLASGTDALMLDIKVGGAAFAQDLGFARALGHALLEVGRGAGLRIGALLSAMDAPLGMAVGNALEVREAIRTLKGEGPEDVVELSVALAADMLVLCGAVSNTVAARQKVETAISSGSGLEAFLRMVVAQGGHAKVAERADVLPSAPWIQELRAPRAGQLVRIDGLQIGRLAMALGAGRQGLRGKIHPGVGLEILVRPGESVSVDQPWARVHAKKAPPKAWRKQLEEAFVYRGQGADTCSDAGGRSVILERL